VPQSTETATVEQAAGPYAYDYDAVAPLAMQKGLPRQKLSSGAWLREVLHVAMAVAHNQHEASLERADIAVLSAQLAHPSPSEFIDLIRTLWRRLNSASPTGRPRTLDDYRDQLRTIPLPPARTFSMTTMPSLGGASRERSRRSFSGRPILAH
jgi:hypothetical protein